MSDEQKQTPQDVCREAMISIENRKTLLLIKNLTMFLLLNLVPRTLKIAFYGFQRFQNFLGEHAPSMPLDSPKEKKRAMTALFYPIQTCWLLQFLLKPMTVPKQRGTRLLLALSD